MGRRRRQALVTVDAGWLFLAPGLAVLAATLILPARADLERARWQRDRAEAIEGNRLERLERYGAYIDALDRGDPSVVLSLAATQLNLAPPGEEPMEQRPDAARGSASVFPELEPEPPMFGEEPGEEGRSVLERLAMHERWRLWLVGGAALSILVGLLPPARGRGG